MNPLLPGLLSQTGCRERLAGGNGKLMGSPEACTWGCGCSAVQE